MEMPENHVLLIDEELLKIDVYTCLRVLLNLIHYNQNVITLLLKNCRVLNRKLIFVSNRCLFLRL